MDPRLVDALKAARVALDGIPPERWAALAAGVMRKIAREHPDPSLRKVAAEVVADMDREGGCRCHGCGRRYRVDVAVPDALWERIRPAGSTGGGGLLCGPCILARVEALGGFASYRLEAS